VEKFGMIYAGAQKNLGPSGQALVLIRPDFLDTAPKNALGRMWDYHIQADKESRFNTPNTFAIYLMSLTFQWIKDTFGTLEEVERFNNEKAKLIYDVIDDSEFFVGHVTETAHRSVMNIPFRTPNEQLDDLFLVEAEKQGLKTLAGHRSTGGMRASIYNAMPVEGCQKLADFMKAFERQHAGKTTVAAS
jgi:phosphoserine aminotransferase